MDRIADERTGAASGGSAVVRDEVVAKRWAEWSQGLLKYGVETAPNLGELLVRVVRKLWASRRKGRRS